MDKWIPFWDEWFSSSRTPWLGRFPVPRVLWGVITRINYGNNFPFALHACISNNFIEKNFSK